MIHDTIRRHRVPLAVASALAAGSALASIVLITQIGAIAGDAGGLPRSALWPAMASLLGMLALSAVAQTFQAHFGAAVISDLRVQLCNRFMALDYERLLSNRERITGALVVDVSRIAQMLLVLPQAFFNVLVAVFCLAYLAWLSWPLLLVLAGFVLLSIACALLILRRTERYFARIREQEDSLFRHFRAIAEAKKELAMNAARAAHFSERVLGRAIGENEIVLRAANRWLGYTEVWNLAIVYAAILSVAYIGRAYLAQDAALVARFVIASLFLIGPVSGLIGAIRQVVAGMASVRHLRALGPAFSGTAAVAAANPARFHGWSRIAFRQVAYCYPDNAGEFRFGPLDLELRRGEMVFVTGGNGSGKSTLSLLLTGMLTPSRGEILVDEQVLAAQCLGDFRQLFTAVFTDYWLFDDLLDRRGESPSQARVDALLHKLGLDRKVSATHGRLSTLDLSQGQRKRLALTQGYVEDSDIYVFDEWAADQDVEFRRYFYLELLPELKAAGKTLVVITHDDRYFGVADRIVRLEYGQVAGDGAAA
ncbi:cyclic peptide export ABC transporter [Xanthomonas sacchari]|uniref:cyclic peptide export ABC transporter n=1 Tax=Xanthomonas sacchari TaxID=56458 RepID=UPI00068CE57E|nr:cyclic peptide export ABC transporter [Xanthomonas sacchari]